MSAPTLKQCLKLLADSYVGEGLVRNGVRLTDSQLQWVIKVSRGTTLESSWTPRIKNYAYDLSARHETLLLANGIDFRKIPAPPPDAPTPVNQSNGRQVQLLGNGKYALLSRYDPKLVDAIKKVLPSINRRWNKDKSWWDVMFPASFIDGKVVADFNNFLFEWKFEVGDAVNNDIHLLLATAIKQEQVREEAFKKSFATEAKIEIPGLHGELRAFQHAGVVYAVEKERTFICDEMGLGKTVQAIAVAEYKRAYPAIIVCPASLRLNWLKELRRWVPDRSCTMDPEDLQYRATEILVVSYNQLVKWYSTLEEIDWLAIILDESHSIKSNKSQRTQAAKDLAKVSHAPIRLCLSGTPIDVCPYEFAPQLTFLGQMEAVGGSKHFYEYFCESDTRGAAHLQELNALLRRTCYIRREKKDVLTELPAKQRDFVPVEIDNRAEYRKAETDLISWLKSEVEKNPDAFEVDDDALIEDDSVDAKKAAVAERAENAMELVRLNALKRIAAKGMLGAAKEWIEDFIASGQKLVVFAHHTEIQQQVFNMFKEIAVWTRDKAGPQAAVDRFQNEPRIKVVVCSISADYAGHTLTAASNVLFLERWWTSTRHDQAEDRVHRIGQRESVMAWYLVPQDTIYEKIDALIQERRGIVAAATNGTTQAPSRKSILRDLIRQLAA